MAKKYSKSLLILLAVCLVGTGVWYFSDNQVEKDTLTQAVPYLKLLNSHSHPEAGEEWVVSFETREKADLTITPQDPDTINDLDFVTLTCNGEERTPQVLENDQIFYPNWECLPSEALAKEGQGQGELTHLVNIARKHTLKFSFGNKAAYAYNNPDSVTDTFTDESKVSATSSVVITGGQVTLASLKSNGESCSSGNECESTHCVDDYCCDTACSGLCEACAASKTGGSDGTCVHVTADTDPDEECTLSYCSNSGNCNGSGDCGYLDGYYLINSDLSVYCWNSGANFRMWPRPQTCDGTNNDGTLNWGPNVLNPSCIGDGSSYPACNYCDGLSWKGYDDWYLPALSQLEDLWTNKTSYSVSSTASYYWSSTEYNSGGAYRVLFSNGVSSYWFKSISYSVRCVRGQ